MLGMFSLLPLLKGWEYRTHTIKDEAVLNGKLSDQVVELDETGWLVTVGVISTDCYGEVIVDWQGADLETRSGGFYAEVYRAAGDIAPSALGWTALYRRPDPSSTFGLFSSGSAPGYWGALFPYVPTLRARLKLRSDSTQDSAYVAGGAATIALTNKNEFVRSLRRILKADSYLHVDPALRTVGPAVMESLRDMEKQLTKEKLEIK